MRDDGTIEANMVQPHALVRLAGAGLRAVRRLARALAHRQEIKRLAELDDRALKDIGLVRSDVAGALAQPFHVDPSTVLLVRRIERRASARVVRVVPPIPDKAGSRERSRPAEAAAAAEAERA